LAEHFVKDEVEWLIKQVHMYHNSEVIDRNQTLSDHRTDVIPDATTREIVLDFVDVCHEPL